jgi:hypothetical protein
LQTKPLHAEPARRAGWFAVAILLLLLAVAPELNVNMVLGACALITAIALIVFALSRQSLVLSLDRDRQTLRLQRSSAFGASRLIIQLSDIASLEVVQVSVGAEDDDGYMLRAILRSGETIALTGSFAAWPFRPDAPPSPPLQVAKAIRVAATGETVCTLKVVQLRRDDNDGVSNS